MAWEHMHLVHESISWLMGPLTGNPREEYSGISPASLFVTGTIMAPAYSAETVAEDSAEGEFPEMEDESTLDTSPVFPINPVLHPDRLPASLGITFAVRCPGKKPKFRVCVTWARYLKRDSAENEEGRGGEERGIWRRYPACRIIDVELEPGGHPFRENFTDREDLPGSVPETRLELTGRAVDRGDGLYTVSLYLVARGPVPPDPRRKRTEDVIFQPQMRIVLGEECRLADMSETMGSWTTEFDIPFIEEGLEVPARGHMCSVIWKDIDPQQLQVEDLPETIVYPFRWVDGEVVREKYGEEAYRTFLFCDLRTEYIPVVEVPAPDVDPEGIQSVAAYDLAEAWNPEEMKKHLEPLLTAYERWVEEKERETGENEHRRNILGRHRKATERMRRSLHLILEDEDVRLAFCFANRAVALQFSWSTGKSEREFKWRPFQLGFFLLVLESISTPDSPDRDTCDLLWIPTGGGKTEAYLGIIAFTLALRRRKYGEEGLGTAVISRYTLRLLGIQQFMRALRLVTACEYLRMKRTQSGLHGWRPESCHNSEDWLWGREWFSTGLWVGGGITPNKLIGYGFPGALDILEEPDRYRGSVTPAQVTVCPACGTLLAVPESDEGIPWGEGIIWFAVEVSGARDCVRRIEEELSDSLRMQLQNLPNFDADFETMESLVSNGSVKAMGIRVLKDFLRAEDLDRLWRAVEEALQECSPRLLSFSPSTPGYFPWGRDDFRTICPSPHCPLRIPGGRYTREFQGTDIVSRPGTDRAVLNLLRESIHIPALTVDEQIYRELPSLLISTVDKFARLPAEPRCAAIFGNVNRFHHEYLFYRHEVEKVRHKNEREISGFRPPELILQDELHLIEGPLGSLTGLYETAVDFLCSETGTSPKYIASTATTRGGGEQIRALFCREAFLFPPQGLRFGDNFFTRTVMEKPGILFRDSGRPGRIYVGVAAFGWSPLTSQVRLFSSLYPAVYSGEFPDDLRRFYRTPVSYYNAVRELAAGLHLFYQDIPDWFRTTRRGLPVPRREKVIELSSRIPSGALPFILRALEASADSPEPPDALLTTSIFGTGVDIPHLSLMVVNGQPKTTSSYIQATGRVGRWKAGIIYTLYRVSRPRDLSHYEFFAGYHRAMYRYVEEASVFPFSRRCFDRGSGGVAVALLRLSRFSGGYFGSKDSACLMQHYGQRDHRINNIVNSIVNIFKERNRNQPEYLRMTDSDLENRLRGRDGGFDGWREIARIDSSESGCHLEYVEYFGVTSDVVLGDLQHERAGRRCVYSRVPQSLRTVEEEIEVEFSAGLRRRRR